MRELLKICDPEGVERRSKHRLKRRRYVNKGPNYLWHMDGYDKLKPFGFCIHGCVDGFSRRIMWLEVSSTSNDPAVVSQYYVDCIKQLGGVPRVVRADCGTENVYVAAIQRFLRSQHNDDMAGIASFMYGKSVSNQRIEAWWGILRKQCWWIRYLYGKLYWTLNNTKRCECERDSKSHARHPTFLKFKQYKCTLKQTE